MINNTNITKFIKFFFFSIATLFLISCGEDNPEDSKEEKNKEQITIKHFMGTTVIPKNPKQVVILNK